MVCNKCAFDPIVKAVATLVDTHMVSVNGANRQLNSLEYFLNCNKSKNKKVCAVAEPLRDKYGALVEFVVAELLPVCQSVCSVCSRNSNDDNLSRQGVVQVSLDALCTEIEDKVSYGEQEMEPRRPGTSGWSEESDNDAFFADADSDDGYSPRHGGADWLRRDDTAVSKPQLQGVTKLPLHIEDSLRLVLNRFLGLSILEQCIIINRLKEKSFVDIGAMQWVPPEMKRANDKQLVSFWWKKILKKFPYVAALSKAKAARKGDRRDADGDYHSSSAPLDGYREQSLDLGVPL